MSRKAIGRQDMASVSVGPSASGRIERSPFVVPIGRTIVIDTPHRLLIDSKDVGGFSTFEDACEAGRLLCPPGKGYIVESHLRDGRAGSRVP